MPEFFKNISDLHSTEMDYEYKGAAVLVIEKFVLRFIDNSTLRAGTEKGAILASPVQLLAQYMYMNDKKCRL